MLLFYFGPYFTSRDNSESKAVKKPNSINFLSPLFLMRMILKTGGLELVWLTALANMSVVLEKETRGGEKVKVEEGLQ